MTKPSAHPAASGSPSQTCDRCGQPLGESGSEPICMMCAAQLGHASWLDAGDVPERGGTVIWDESAPGEEDGVVVGRYKLLEKLGEGGFGTVWVAEQREPVKRRVALKIIKLGMDTRQVVARFEAERQALALMDHPNIAKVLDAGSTDTGRPYFVMELVKGIPITSYCDQEKLLTQERLDLFIKVCQAIQHAHQKGIIHRDIKPSNILVTLHDGVPVPKVIDFGIAKATQAELTEKTVYTQYHQFIGTPAYMSPEQAEMSGLDIDTRSDIYSLGVLLYELLTGTTPFDTKELLRSGLDEMRKIIREREPTRPSTRLGQTQSARAVNGDSQSRSVNRKSQIDADLDWIVLKCLEKDRVRRYETANGLAMDIRRHLDNEPVAARPPSAVYRIQKAWKRSKVLYTAAATVAVALITGFTVSFWQTMVAQRLRNNEAQQRALADTNARESRRNAYVADMNLGLKALQRHDRARVLEFVNRYWPRAGEEDLRGWEWRYLWMQCQSQALYALTQYDTYAFRMEFSPDGRYLAIGGYDPFVDVWDVSARNRIMRFAHRGTLVAVAFSPRTNLLASASKRGDLKLWSGPSFDQPVHSIEAGAPLRWLSFSPDGEWLAAFATDNTARLWKLATMEESRFPVGSFVGAFSGAVAFDAGSQRLAIGETDGRIRMLALPGGEELPIRFIAQHHEGAVVSRPSGQPSPEKAHAGGVFELAFSPDGTILASSSAGEIKLWDAITGEELDASGLESGGGDIAFSADGTVLAFAGDQNTVGLWDVESSTLMATLRGHLTELFSLAFSPDGQTLVSCDKLGTVLLWSAATKSAEPGVRIFPGTKHGPVFSPDGRTLAVRDADSHIVLLDCASWQEDRLDELGPVKVDGWSPVYDRSVLFSPDGRLVAATGATGELKVFDLHQRRIVKVIPTEVDGICGIRFLARNRSLMTTHRLRDDDVEHVVREWGVDSWDERPAQSEFHQVIAVDVSPDERWVATTHQDQRVLLWDRRHPAPAVLLGKKYRGRPMLFAPDSRFLATGGEDGLTKIWDIAGGMEVTLQGADHVFSISFSTDGSRLAVGATSLTLWDMRTFREVGTLETAGTLETGITAVFSPDGETVAAADRAGHLHLWRAPSLEEIDRAEHASGGPRGPNETPRRAR